MGHPLASLARLVRVVPVGFGITLTWPTVLLAEPIPAESAAPAAPATAPAPLAPAAVTPPAGKPRATAPTAADKATAREAATQGIQHYREARYEQALDLLKRAQALYDAPVHEHYIARCQRELGFWIEAAEGFRELSRRELDVDAPPQWHEAVAEAGRELDELEPQIPRLRIRVEPADAEVSRLAIDDIEVPSAVIGMERLVNPGPHRVTVVSPGHRPAERTIEASASTVAAVVVVLEKETTAAAASPEAPVETDATAALAKPTKDRYEVLFGLRLGAAVPGGKLPAAFARPLGQGDAVDFTEVAGSGGSLELRIGFSGPLRFGFMERWGAHLFVSGGSLAGKELPLDGTPFAVDGLAVNTKPAFTSGGVALAVGHARDRFGMFLELGMILHSLTVGYETAESVVVCQERATAERSGNGFGARASAGVGIPVASWGLVAPYLAASVDSMRSMTFSSNDCFGELFEQADAALPSDRENLDGSVTHTFLGLGVGGELYVGL